MNSIERKIYDLVKSQPWIKNIIRNTYQGVFDLMPKRKNYFKSSHDIQEGYFFGFHDVSPFSDDESMILANKPSLFLKMPTPGQALEVGYFNLVDDKMMDFKSCSTSLAWNHHKGCRLQWLSKSEFIFNTVHSNNSLGSSIFNIENSKIIKINHPIDAVFKGKKIATSFSYERLEKLMPGYGYPYPDDSFLRENDSKFTGLFLVDLERDSKVLLVSLDSLIKEVGDENLRKFRHYVTHSEFSHDGRYISFLHRWVGDDVLKRSSRLVIYDLKENKFFPLPTSGMVSHYVWNSKNQIIAYCSVQEKDGHVLFDVPNVTSFKQIATNILNSDGHQSFISDEIFITDTYPDKYRAAKIYKVDIMKDKVELLVSVYSPKKYQSKLPHKHIACDLHPRVSPSGKYISFDTVYTGTRSLALLKNN